jgi:hypothetical protein
MSCEFKLKIIKNTLLFYLINLCSTFFGMISKGRPFAPPVAPFAPRDNMTLDPKLISRD